MASPSTRVARCTDPSLCAPQRNREKAVSNRWCYLAQVSLATHRAKDALGKIGEPQVTEILVELTAMITRRTQDTTQFPTTVNQISYKVADLVRTTSNARLSVLGVPKASVYQEWTKLIALFMAMLDISDMAAKDQVADLYGVPRGSKTLQKWLGIAGNARAAIMASTQASLPEVASKWISLAYLPNTSSTGHIQHS